MPVTMALAMYWCLAKKMSWLMPYNMLVPIPMPISELANDIIKANLILRSNLKMNFFWRKKFTSIPNPDAIRLEGITPNDVLTKYKYMP